MDSVDNIHWWQWWPFFRWRIVALAVAADEVPERLPRNGAVFIGTPHHPKWLVFDCPCRSGHRIMLPLDASRKPYWRVFGPKPLSVQPSVDYAGPDRRCHYFIKNGRVIWCADSQNN